MLNNISQRKKGALFFSFAIIWHLLSIITGRVIEVVSQKKEENPFRLCELFAGVGSMIAFSIIVTTGLWLLLFIPCRIVKPLLSKLVLGYLVTFLVIILLVAPGFELYRLSSHFYAWALGYSLVGCLVAYSAEQVIISSRKKG